MKTQFNQKLETLHHDKTFTSFYERVAGNASSVVFWDKLQNDFLNFIPEGGKILEIGSGPGFQALKIHQHRPDVEIIVSDFSDKMVSLGKKNYQAMISRNENIKRFKSNISFVQADAMDLSQFGSEKFDGIYSLTAIKHFPNPIHGLYESIKILKPGGRMFFSDFFAEASLVATKNFAKYVVRVPDFIQPIIVPLSYFVTKNKAPHKADIENWKKKLSSKGFCHSEYLHEYPFFILKLEKNRL